MPLIARQRSRLAVLAVLALVGSLLAVSAVPAVAAGDKEPTYPATYKACVGAAEEDAGLTDMDGHAFEAEANCLAHYNITKGTSEGVFSPSASVTRLQMALFLARAAGPAGIELLDPAEDQGFADIDGYTSEIQDAINQIAELEIMEGTDDDAFSPDGMVTRADMAVFLDAFVEASPIGPGGLDGAAKYSDVKPNDDPFDDVASVSFGSYNAIRRVYELGIAKGTGEGDMFSPSVLVTRGQMAAFITRALDHTNARPAGISIQADKESVDEIGNFELVVSVRDDDHAPVADAVVDIFSASSADAAFDEGGNCKDLKEIADPVEASERCEIDAGDESTDSDGNRAFDITLSEGDYCPGNTKWIWAWTGDIGDDFDSDDTDAAMVGVGVSKRKTGLEVATDAPEHATHVPFGTTVVFSVQVVDNDDDPVAEKDVKLTILTIETQVVDEKITNTRRATQTHKTDESGRVELSYSYNDPDPEEGANDPDVSLSVTLMADDAGLLPADDDLETPGVNEAMPLIGWLTWSDGKARPQTLALGQSIAYHEASDTGGGVRHSVTATLVDQYGDPVAGAPIRFWSDANNGNRRADDSQTDSVPPTHPGDEATDDQLETYEEELAEFLDDPLNRNDDGLGGAKGSTAVGSAKRSTWTDTNENFEVDDNEVVHTADPDNFRSVVKTNRSGAAKQAYRRDSKEAQHETVGAVYVIGKRDGAMTEYSDGADREEDPDEQNDEFNDIHGDADAVTAGSQNMSHYWATAVENTAMGTVLVGDTDANIIVIDGDDSDQTITPELAKYDSNDQFNHGAGADPGGVKMDVFERALKAKATKAGPMDIDLASDPEPGVNKFINQSDEAEVPETPTCHD